MRILIISETLWPYGSGGELATYLFAKLLQEHGISIKVVVKHDTWVKEWSGLKVFRVNGFGFGKYFVLTHRSKELLKKLILFCGMI